MLETIGFGLFCILAFLVIFWSVGNDDLEKPSSNDFARPGTQADQDGEWDR